MLKRMIHNLFSTKSELELLDKFCKRNGFDMQAIAWSYKEG